MSFSGFACHEITAPINWKEGFLKGFGEKKVVSFGKNLDFFPCTCLFHSGSGLQKEGGGNFRGYSAAKPEPPKIGPKQGGKFSGGGGIYSKGLFSPPPPSPFPPLLFPPLSIPHPPPPPPLSRC